MSCFSQELHCSFLFLSAKSRQRSIPIQEILVAQVSDFLHICQYDYHPKVFCLVL